MRSIFSIVLGAVATVVAGRVSEYPAGAGFVSPGIDGETYPAVLISGHGLKKDVILTRGSALYSDTLDEFGQRVLQEEVLNDMKFSAHSGKRDLNSDLMGGPVIAAQYFLDVNNSNARDFAFVQLGKSLGQCGVSYIGNSSQVGNQLNEVSSDGKKLMPPACRKVDKMFFDEYGNQLFKLEGSVKPGSLYFNQKHQLVGVGTDDDLVFGSDNMADTLSIAHRKIYQGEDPEDAKRITTKGCNMHPNYKPSCKASLG